MTKISHIHARELYDSRGTPTVEAEVSLSDGSMGSAIVPSGASTGIHEALELRDGGARLSGKGVTKAVENVRTQIANALIGMDIDQRLVDQKMIALDGSENKKNLGANAMLAVSMALSKATATSYKQPLWQYFRSLSATVPSETIMPMPMMNILNGGRHADKSTDIQECMILPIGATSFKHAMEMGVNVFMALKGLLKNEGFATTVGDEGGFAPQLPTNEAALSLIGRAVANAGYEFGKDISIGIDAAASEFFENSNYELRSEGKRLTTDEMIGLYTSWASKFPIVSLEDALEQDDWDGYQKLTQSLGKKMQLVGDDLFVTNIGRLKKGIDMKVCNSILIKLNQIGTVSETVDAIDLARKNGYTAIVSHRSGETEDATIADFVVGLSTGQIKTGSLSRSDRVAKYNQLLRIEESLGNKAVFAAAQAFIR